MKIAIMLMLLLTVPAIAHARLTCTETLTGKIVCVDKETGQRLERREKLTGEIDFVETSPPTKTRKERNHGSNRDDRRR